MPDGTIWQSGVLGGFVASNDAATRTESSLVPIAGANGITAGSHRGCELLAVARLLRLFEFVLLNGLDFERCVIVFGAHLRK